MAPFLHSLDCRKGQLSLRFYPVFRKPQPSHPGPAPTAGVFHSLLAVHFPASAIIRYGPDDDSASGDDYTLVGMGRRDLRAGRCEEKLILLDVGATWCHWCHVMDHQTYADGDVARAIEEKFLPVRVDRDRQPHLDELFQRARPLAGSAGRAAGR